MKKTRRRYDRAFKISVVAELESGKPIAQIAREHSIHPGLSSRWREELAGISDPHAEIASTMEYAAEDYELKHIPKSLTEKDLFDTTLYDSLA